MNISSLSLIEDYFRLYEWFKTVEKKDIFIQSFILRMNSGAIHLISVNNSIYKIQMIRAQEYYK